MAKSKLEQKVIETHHLDAATQAIITKIDKNDRRLRVWAFATLTLLLIVGLVGIYKQNQIATQSKQHIDCIIKDLSTPQPAGTNHKYIDYQSQLSADCKIKFN